MPRKPAVPDVSKLPRWAQWRIAALEADVRRAENAAYHATTPGKSNTEIRECMDRKGLPPHSRIRFGDDGNWLEVRLLNRSDPREVHQFPTGVCVLEITCGTGRVSVHPGVANVVYVKAEER